jgi:predicted nucleic acid-binding protein
MEPPGLRALDALHLAAALTLGPDLSGIVGYGERLLRAASDAGIATVLPGA